jgi:hypothetical protein
MEEEMSDKHPKYEIIGVYKLGNIDEIDLKGQDWHDMLHATMMAIMASAPKLPKELTYSTGMHTAGRVAYIVLASHHATVPGWRESNTATLVRKAFNEEREPGKAEGVEVNLTFLLPPKNTAEYKARLGYAKAYSNMVGRHQKQLEYIGKAVKGEWPKEEDEG